MISDTQKLRVLHTRTDHDLAILVQRELERGLTAAELATTKSSQLYSQAQKSYQIATTLLPRISVLSADDRLRIEAEVRQLKNSLEQVPAFANVRPSPASFAS